MMRVRETKSSLQVRVSEQAYRTLKDLSEETGQSMQGILDVALESYRRKHFIIKANEAFAALKADPAEWKSEQVERSVWDLTSLDGQDRY